MWAYNDKAWGQLLGDYKPGELMAARLKSRHARSPTVGPTSLNVSLGFGS
jgi:hypothetical protein